MQNVDWMGSEAAAQLDLGFTVLVPSNVPSPFGGEPAIDAGGGYYSLYWIVSGGVPTFLQITGEVGGSLPAGSPYDLNIELSINASVQGYDAIHDVTPAYDAVWWIADGVTYKVESLNMQGADSLGLANSLIGFIPPESAPVEVPTEPPHVIPNPEDTSQPDTETDPTAVVPGADTNNPVLERATEESTSATVTPTATATAPSDPTTPATTPVQQGSGTDGTGSNGVLSDGTGGPAPPVVGTDGTGGTSDLRVSPLQPTPAS